MTTTSAPKSLKRAPKKQGKATWLGLLAMFALLVVWVVATDLTQFANPLKLPYPSNVAQTAGNLGFDIFGHIWATSIRLYLGLIAGVVLGVACGLAMASNRYIEGLLDPFIELFRPVPALAFIPFFILWMGIGDAPKILLVAMGCFLTMVVSTLEAARNQPRDYVRAARTLGAKEPHIYRTVVLPGIFPSLFAGIRLSSALAFTLVVAAEFMGAQQGIGYMILVAQRTLDTAAMLYGIVLIAAMSYLTDLVIRRWGARAMKWTDRAAAA